MAASSGTAGKGTKVSHAAGTTTTYTEFAQIVDPNGPNQGVDDIEITNNDSAANTKEYIPGWIEPGEVTFKLKYKKAEANTVRGLVGVAGNFKITYGDASTEVFPGYIKAYGVESPTAGAIECSCTVKVAGAGTYTPSTT